MLEQRKEDGHQQHPAGGLPPLHGIRVIDWTHVLAGPYSSHILCRLGAEVIRIERHDEPDIIRGTASDPLLAARELGEGFVIQGTGKKSIAVDARDPRMRAALDKLIGTADVLVENFRPGKLSRLGFAPQSLIERHPNLVVCSITGFGQTGARSGRRAYDHIIQAATGLMVANADQSGQPQRIGLPIIDYVTGMQAAIAILAALQRRAHELARGRPRTRGEWLDVSMLESALTVSAQSYATYAVSGIERQASRATAFSGNPLSGTFPAAQAGWLAIVCNTETQAQAFFTAMTAFGIADGQLQRLRSCVAARDVDGTHAWLAPVMAQRSASDWERFLRDHEVPAAEVLSPAGAYEAAKDDTPDWLDVTLSNVDGRSLRLPGAGFSSSEPLAAPGAPPPRRGADTLVVLRSLGLDERELLEARASGALYQPNHSEANAHAG